MIQLREGRFLELPFFHTQIVQSRLNNIRDSGVVFYFSVVFPFHGFCGHVEERNVLQNFLVQFIHRPEIAAVQHPAA
jgi:hypothetical protein